MGDATLDNVRRYEPHAGPLFAAEESAFRRFLRPGMAVLDLGCGNGRVSRQLVEFGVRVYACDLNLPALREFRGSLAEPEAMPMFCADARRLPLRAGALDAVVFAYNGLDFIAPETERIRALREIERLLKPGGVFLFSSHNPVGGLLSPRGLRSLREWGNRLRGLPSVFRPYPAKDRRGISLYQASPGSVVRQVAKVTELQFAGLRATRTARAFPRPLVTLFSAWPSYAFVKADPEATKAAAGPTAPRASATGDGPPSP